MNADSEAQPESVNGRLADYLAARKETIIQEWLDRVRADPAIGNATLTTMQLKDHLPELFDDLSATLRRYGSTAVAEQAGEDARTHGDVRWQQGYSLTEMLRELKHLRSLLIYHRHVFWEMHPDFGLASRLFASATIHGFLDECGISATEQFLRSKDQQA